MVVSNNVTCFFLFLFIASCIEPYEFIVRDESQTLVVEAMISNQSFNETLLYPSDGRYFTVKLSETGDVTNNRATPVLSALVTLLSDGGETWEYSESDPVNSPGVYVLQDDDFDADRNTKYKLQIRTGEVDYESGWESMPTAEAPVMGAIGFTETDVLTYAIELNKQIIKTTRGITANIDISKNNSGETLYYRWKFTPMWVFQAPLSPSAVLPGYRCWVSSNLYLRDYTLQQDLAGGYTKDLFFMATIRNERIYEDFTIIVAQQSMTEPYYYFWKEMQEQTKAGAIFDAPPFNLKSNMIALNSTNEVVGYFGVVEEQAKRWYFNYRDLSYAVENTLRKDCTVPGLPPGPSCSDCRQYQFGEAVNVKPSWWR
jgi:hypothetical protein